MATVTIEYEENGTPVRKEYTNLVAFAFAGLSSEGVASLQRSGDPPMVAHLLKLQEVNFLVAPMLRIFAENAAARSPRLFIPRPGMPGGGV